jgi:hypothetical protein
MPSEGMSPAIVRSGDRKPSMRRSDVGIGYEIAMDAFVN